MSAERKNLRNEKIKSFNPNENGLYESGLFGLPFTPDESELVILPVPWEATVSYGVGTAMGPETVLNASKQLDLYDPLHPSVWEQGVAMLPIDYSIMEKSTNVRERTEEYLKKYMQGDKDEALRMEVDGACRWLKDEVKRRSLEEMRDGRMVALLGGEHSVSLGYFEALGEVHGDFGILQIDAHADLRDAYEGLEYSHASIFFNALKNEKVKKLVQAGIRDISESEHEMHLTHKDRVEAFYDYDIRHQMFEGKKFEDIADDIVDALPEQVCISFDIDGLDPTLCPHTGTPVAGGFSFNEVVYLLEKVLKKGKKIIGFDLVEVSPSKGGDEWDGNVGARILYKLSLLALESKNREEEKGRE